MDTTTGRMVYVVVGSDGDYEEYRERWLRAYFDKSAAERERDRMTALHAARLPAYKAMRPDDDLEPDEWLRKMKIRDGYMRKTGELLADPEVDYDTTYCVRTIPLVGE